MRKRLHNNDELLDSPQYGWEELKFLLDTNLPVKANNGPSILRAGIAASLTTLLLLCSLIIHNHSVRLVSLNNYQSKEIQNADENTFKKEKHTVQTVCKLNFKQTIFEPGTDHNLAERKVNEPSVKQQLFPAQNAEELVRIDRANLETENGLNIETISTKSVHDSIPPLSRIAVSADVSDKICNYILHKSRLQFSVGAAVNITPEQRQSLQPFPVAEVLLKSSSDFYLSMGLTVGSVVATSGHGVSKTVYLNDTANNIQFYNKVTRYTRLYYADLPLMAGVQLGKRWSAEGGLQASILLNTKSKEFIDKYDFQRRQANVAQNSLMGTAAAVLENNYQVTPLKIDYRFVGGLRYSMHKTAFDLTYQYAFRPVFKGKQVTANRNQLLTFKVLYKLK